MAQRFVQSILSASAIAIAAATGAVADTTWTPASTEFPGSMRAGSREVPIRPGDETSISMQQLPAGTTVIVLHGAEPVTEEPLTAGEDGQITVEIKVPSDAEVGLHPLTVLTQNPASVSQVVLKLSDVVEPMNAESYNLESAEVGERAYQSAPSANGKLFVASARGPNDGSRLLRLNAETLEVEAEAELAKDDAGEDIAVFGVAVDNSNNQVWTTNTRSETVTVYDANDLSVVKVFPQGSVYHPRSVVIDEDRGRAYVSAARTGFVEIYDTANLEHIGHYQFSPEKGSESFSTVDLALDTENGRLYSVSQTTPWVGWVDLESDEVSTVKIPQAQGATGVAVDPETQRVFISSQDTNNVVVLDKDGAVIADTYIGAGGVSAAWNPASGHAFAVSRAGGTVAVLDIDGNLIANIPAGQTPNHVSVGAEGEVYLISMYGNPETDSQTGSVTKITTAE